jgi:hypothetical protein
MTALCWLGRLEAESGGSGRDRALRCPQVSGFTCPMMPGLECPEVAMPPWPGTVEAKADYCRMEARAAGLPVYEARRDRIW